MCPQVWKVGPRMRFLIAFLLVLLVSPLMYLGSAFRQANISGYAVFSEKNLVAAFPLFSVAFLIVFVGLCIPWTELAGSGVDEKNPRGPNESRRPPAPEE